jgi:signal transduction histidine kinase
VATATVSDGSEEPIGGRVPLPWLRLGVGIAMAVYALLYEPPDGVEAPDGVVFVALFLAGALIATSLLQFRWQYDEAVAFLITDGVLILGYIYAFTFDPRRFLFPLFVWVVIQAAFVAGLRGAILGWTFMSIAYGLREVVASAQFDQHIDVAAVILRLFIGLASALVAGSLNIASLARREAVHEREFAVRLKELDDMRNMFLRALSHDLRSPLSVIVGFTELLKAKGEEVSPEMRGEMLGSIDKSARKVQAMLTDLLDVDRISRGLLDADKKHVDLSEIVRRVLEDVNQDEHHIELEAPPTLAWVDPPKVERVVENLVLNAVRHTAPGTPVIVRVDGRDGGAVLTVEDQGPGIPDAMKEVVFDAFVRVKDAPRQAAGTGIGLSLVAGFAEMHGGRAWVEDREGGGSAFKVLFPDVHLESADGESQNGPRARKAHGMGR